jgi:topoisomerase-4 subunit A
LFETGEAAIRFEPGYITEGKTVTIHSFPPNVNVVGAITRLSTKKDLIGRIDDVTDLNGPRYQIQAAKGHEAGDILAEVIKAFSSTMYYKVKTADRTPDDSPDGYTTQFRAVGIITLLSDWITKRIELEKRALAESLRLIGEAISYNELLVLATKNRKVILAALESKDPAKVIKAKLKITEDQANQILELRIRQLSKLETDKLLAKIKEQRATQAELKRFQERPAERILGALAHLPVDFERKRLKKGKA